MMSEDTVAAYRLHKVFIYLIQVLIIHTGSILVTGKYGHTGNSYSNINNDPQ